VVEIKSFVDVDHRLDDSFVRGLHNTRQVNHTSNEEAHAQSVDPVDSEKNEVLVSALPLVNFPLKLDVQGADDSAQDTKTHK